VPDHALALLTLAQLENARGDGAIALVLTDRCLKDPRTARAAWTLRSVLLQRVGNTNEAQSAATRAASLPPDLPVQDPFANDARQARSDPRWLSDQAQRFLAARQPTNATPFVEQLLREHPGFAETWLVAGRFQLMQRRLEEAEASLSRHLAMETNSVNGLFQLGLVLLEQDKLGEAATAFARAVKMKPDFGPAYFNLGVALGRSGQKPEAVASFREAIRHNPERIDSYILLADLLFDLGGRSQAQEVARQAEALNPADRRLVQLRSKIGRE
jgi:tetratricopeptide (TPR) repeat protein